MKNSGYVIALKLTCAELQQLVNNKSNTLWPLLFPSTSRISLYVDLPVKQTILCVFSFVEVANRALSS